MRCIRCEGHAVKNGKSEQGKQRYRCTDCRRSFTKDYAYRGHHPSVDNLVVKLLKEGVGMRGIGRVTGISKNTVSRKIMMIASGIERPAIPMGRTYQMDELRTFLGKKRSPIWVSYAIDSATKEVTDFRVGGRGKKVLGALVEPLLAAGAKRIDTDGLRTYQALIPEEIHRVKHRKINHIERKHLTLRTHLKRLSRKTICFNRSLVVLEACLTIYFWG